MVLAVPLAELLELGHAGQRIARLPKAGSRLAGR
jgi:hypothetical protein